MTMTDNKTIRDLLLGESTTAQLEARLASHAADFLSQLRQLQELNMEVTPAKRGVVLALLWAGGWHSEAAQLLTEPQFKQPAVVAKAVQALDAGRKVRAMDRRLQTLQGRAGKCKVRALKTSVNNLKQEEVKGGLSGSAVRLLKRWAREIPKEQLEFWLLMFEKQVVEELWKPICDVLHTKPSDFQLPYFQGVVFGGAAPEGSMVAAVHSLTPDSLAETLNTFPHLLQCYSALRKVVPPAQMPEEARLLLAEKSPLEDMLWQWEELHSPAVDEMLAGRLEAQEQMGGRMVYGKLMERLLKLRAAKASLWPHLLGYAERQLAALAAQHSSDAKVVVMGDASASMQVAINSACVVASMLCATMGAELCFFNKERFTSKHGMPRTAEDCLKVTDEVRANYCTSMAAALWPYYEKKQKVDLFVMVSDEGENTACKGYKFAALFDKYRQEVNPLAKCFFVSFLRPQEKGHLVTSMDILKLPCPQFRFDPSRPDLSKFDALLGAVLLEVQGQQVQDKVLEEMTNLELNSTATK